MVAQGLRGFLVPVRGSVVEDDDCAGLNLRDQHFVDVGGKGGTVHCAFDDPRCNQRILCLARDQGLGSPTAKTRRTCTRSNKLSRF